MQRAFADRDEQRGFCRKLEQMLQQGEADAALALVRQGLEALADNGLPIVAVALATQPEALVLTGWDDVAATIAREEAQGQVISALGIDFSWPGHVGLEPDSEGLMAPYLETSYYADLSDMAFSTASRAEILAGYSGYGSCWQGNFSDIDNAIEVQGMSALYGAVAGSDDRDRDNTAGDAYLLAACASAILLHLAVKRHIETSGLPKPMAVLVGSNEDFPFFDAPVASIDEARALMPAPVAPAPAPQAMAPIPDAGESLTGTALRSRIAQTASPEADTPVAPPAKGLLARLFGR